MIDSGREFCKYFQGEHYSRNPMKRQVHLPLQLGRKALPYGKDTSNPFVNRTSMFDVRPDINS